MAWRFLGKDKKEENLTHEQLEELEFNSKIDAQYQSLESETTQRLNQYRLYNQFRQGIQWGRDTTRKSDGAERLTHNFCDPIVAKYANLLMGDVPKLLVPRASETQPKLDLAVLETPPKASEYEVEVPVEFDRSEAIEKILRECLFVKNRLKIDLKAAALNGSELGDSVFYVYWNKEKKHPCIEKIFPGHIRIGFSSSDSDDIEFAFIEKIMSLDEIERKWGIQATAEMPSGEVWDLQQFINRKVALIQYYWNKEYYCVRVNGMIIPGTKQSHSYSRIPLFHIPNKLNGFSPWGESDIKQIITIQESYNKAISDEANLSKMYADPKVIVYNPGKTDLKAIGKSGSKVIPATKDSRVEPLAFTGQIFPMQNRISRIKQDLHDVSAMPAAAFGNAQGSIVTGVAMTAQFQPTLQAIMDKIALWDDGLRRMMSFVLELYEQFGGKYPGTKLTYKQIINGWRTVEFQWGSKTPRDDSIFIQNEMLKMNQRIQSRARTMTNLGIDSPQDELQQIALEENNPTLNPKLAIEKAAIDSQTGEGQEPEMIAIAESENEKMAAGQVVPSIGKNKKEHKIHIEVHGNFIKNTPDLPPDIIDIIDQHIQGHEQALATGGSQGGIRIGAGRKAEEAGPSAAPSEASPDMAALAAALPQALPPEQTEGY